MADDEDMRDERGRFVRAFTAPARAMNRILGSEGNPPVTPPSEPHDAIVDCAVYVDGVRLEGTPDYNTALAMARQHRGAYVWLGLREPCAEQMAGIAEAFKLHELAVDDVLSKQQRPKLEPYGEVHFLILRAAKYVPHEELTDSSEVVETGQIMLFVGPDFVITIRHGNAVQLAPVRHRLQKRPELLKFGPWAVAYGVLDHVVDIYLDTADAIGGDVDVLEEAAFDRNKKTSGRMQQTYQLKRELVEFKRAVLPLLRPMSQLIGDTPEIGKDLRKYFRDVQDHLSRVAEQINAYDDLLISVMQARLAQVTVDQGEDMRKIASWAAIAAVWTAIAGVYGMNFDHMPELKWLYGYPLVLGVMLGFSYLLYRSLRKNGWL